MDIVTPTPPRRYDKYRAHNQSVDDTSEITRSEPWISQPELIRKSQTNVSAFLSLLSSGFFFSVFSVSYEYIELCDVRRVS